jgi:hypothetical protein
MVGVSSRLEPGTAFYLFIPPRCDVSQDKPTRVSPSRASRCGIMQLVVSYRGSLVPVLGGTVMRIHMVSDSKYLTGPE